MPLDPSHTILGGRNLLSSNSIFMTLTHDSCCPLRYPEFPDPVSLCFKKMKKSYHMKVDGDDARKEENVSIK